MKKINKHWGHEIWISDGTSTPYALKRILFRAGNRTSLQVHKFKHETNYVLSGYGKLIKSQTLFDIDNFLVNGMTEQDIELFEAACLVIDLYPEFKFDVEPGYVHRVIATTDLEFIEVSTTELDDVYRLQDDQGRTHGRILQEHE